MKRRIPVIQERSLYPLADDLEASGLLGYARRLRRYTTELYRRKGHYRVRGTRTPISPVLILKIRACAKSHPRWTQQHIAEKFNVTNARVSEALHGKRR